MISTRNECKYSPCFYSHTFWIPFPATRRLYSLVLIYQDPAVSSVWHLAFSTSLEHERKDLGIPSGNVYRASRTVTSVVGRRNMGCQLDLVTWSSARERSVILGISSLRDNPGAVALWGRFLGCSRSEAMLVRSLACIQV